MSDYPDLSQKVEQSEFSVETTAGLFERRVGESDDENTHIWWVEYLLNGQIIRHSAHVYNKRGVSASAVAASFGG